MSFDTDPEEDKRYLLYHPDSDSLFEVLSWAEAKPCLAYGCDDVTDDPKWEAQLKKEQKERKNGN